MSVAPSCDEDLVRHLPLPLAQLYRRAHNAKTPLERHWTAYYHWEAGLKLLGSVAIVAYADRRQDDTELAQRLTKLARPALGHWWEFVRSLVPGLADGGDVGFGPIRELLLGTKREDLPRAAGLDALLRKVLEHHTAAQTTVKLADLFGRLLEYRNRELGHGAAGQREESFYDELGRAILAGVAEVFRNLDVLAGRRLVYMDDVRQLSGSWLIQGYELVGEAARRFEFPSLPVAAGARPPLADRVYLCLPDCAGQPEDLRSLHPLLIFQAETAEVFFLNARLGERRTEYLCYTTGRRVKRGPDAGEECELLGRVLGRAVNEQQFQQWQTQAQGDEPPVKVNDQLPIRQLGEFELLSVLGKGGMGIVYRARQPSLDRQVALKCLLDPGGEARFAREIRTLGRVEHAHLVKIFTSGNVGDQWFYAMELLPGATLAAVCSKLAAFSDLAGELGLETWRQAVSTANEESQRAERGLGDAPTGEGPAEPQPVANTPPLRIGMACIRQIVELTQQVAEAAHALHEAKIIHRDIKPGNVMVSPDGTHAVLMDLGLAQLADEQDRVLTRTRQFVGTLRYASPEQVLAADRLDRRTDVYSLGATLWELLTLRPLYGATDQVAAPKLMERIQYQEPERVRRYNPGVPIDLEAIVLRCLEKDKTRRYATAAQLAADLRHWLDGELVSARPARFTYRVSKYVRRHRSAIVIGLVLCLMSLGSAATIYYLHQARRDAENALELALQIKPGTTGTVESRTGATTNTNDPSRPDAPEEAVWRTYIQEKVYKGKADEFKEWREKTWGILDHVGKKEVYEAYKKEFDTLSSPRPFYFGNAACIDCHSAGDRVGPLLCRCTEATIFVKEDKHAQAFMALLSEQAQRMGRQLGIKVQQYKRCLSCHSVLIEDRSLVHVTFRQEDGITCTVCHGPYENWIDAHGSVLNRKQWRALSRQLKEERYGMRDLWDPVKRTKLCVSCHVGNPSEGKVVTHAMYAAGHPVLMGFEVAAFSDAMPRHWERLREKRPEVQRLLGYNPQALENLEQLVLGACVTLRETMDLVASEAERCAEEKHPEKRKLDLALMGCASCHHRLFEKSKELAQETRKSHAAAQRWPFALPGVIANNAARDDRPFTAMFRGLNQSITEYQQVFDTRDATDLKEIAAAARKVARWSDAFIALLQTSKCDSTTAWRYLRGIAELGKEDLTDYHTARQVGYAVHTIHGELSPDSKGVAEIGSLLNRFESEFTLHLYSSRQSRAQAGPFGTLRAEQAYDAAKLKALLEALQKALP